MMQAMKTAPLEDIAMVVQGILADMERCVAEQEGIIIEERAAVKVFDGNKLSELLERRVRCQSELGELESRCQRLVMMADVGDKFDDVIETYAVDDADALQSQRIELVRRMQGLERDHIENHIRLRAAWNVTTSILQQVGVVETNPTYGNTSANYAAPQQVTG